MRKLKRDLESLTGEFLASEVKLLSEQRKIALRRNLGETEAVCEYCGAKLPYLAYLFEGRVVTVRSEPVRCDCEKAQAYWAEQDAEEKAKEEKARVQGFQWVRYRALELTSPTPTAGVKLSKRCRNGRRTRRKTLCLRGQTTQEKHTS